MPNQIAAGTTKISRMSISNHDRTITYDIRDIVMMLEIYEDLFEPTMYGTMLIEDTSGLLYDFPFIGEEELHVAFIGPQQDPNAPAREAKFLVYACDVIRPIEGHRGMQMRMHFASVERLIERYSDVSRSWKNMAIEEMIEDILTNEEMLHSEKEFDFEPSQGTHTFVIPHLPAFKAIQLLAKYATSSSNYTSPYVFYENFDGFNFHSIEYLVKRGLTRLDDTHKYFYTPSISVAHDEKDLNRIVSLAITNTYNSLIKLDKGVIRNRVQMFDILNKNIEKTDFKYSEQWEQFTQLNTRARGKTQSVKWIENAEEKGDGRSMTVIVDRSLNREYRYDTLGQRVAFSHLLADTVMEIGVTGSTYLTVGDVIEITFPKMDDIGRGDSNSGEEKYLSGIYLIRSIKHTFTVDLYSITMQVRRYENPFDIEQLTGTNSYNG